MNPEPQDPKTAKPWSPKPWTSNSKPLDIASAASVFSTPKHVDPRWSSAMTWQTAKMKQDRISWTRENSDFDKVP